MSKSRSGKTTAPNKRIQARNRKKRSKIYSAIYYSFLGLTVVAILAFFVYASQRMRAYVMAFEAAQPSYAEAEAARPFLTRDYAAMAACEDPSVFESESFEQYCAYMDELLSGREISYTEVRSADENVKRYDVTAGDNKIGEFTIKHTANDPDYDFWLWEKGDMSMDVLAPTTYTVETPEYAQVRVDGKLLSDEYVIRWDIPEFDTVALPDNASVPTRCVYEFSRYFGVGDIEVRDKLGRPCELTQSGTHYSAAFNYDDDRLASEMDDRVIEVVRRLTCFMSNDYALRQLKKDMIAGSRAEKTCDGFDTRWILDHKSYDFHDMQVNKYISYGSACFSVEASYDFEVIYYRSDPETYPTHYRLYFQKEGDTWKLFDFVLL